MALRTEHVLMTLQDARLANVDFWLGGLHIHFGAYKQVADAIVANRIHVIPGDNPEWASYYSSAGTRKLKNGTLVDVRANTLVTQDATILDDSERALLIHECTHAYVDLSCAGVTTSLSDEVAAYIAQVTFEMAAAKGQKPKRDGSRFGRMYHGIGDIVRKFRLNDREGRGATLQLRDYAHLRALVHHVKEYHDIGWTQLSGANGV